MRSDDDRLSDDELEAMRERLSAIPGYPGVRWEATMLPTAGGGKYAGVWEDDPTGGYNRMVEGTAVEKATFIANALDNLSALLDEVERLRDERQKLADTLRACVSDSDLDDWVLEITDE